MSAPETSGTVETPGFAEHLHRTVGPIVPPSLVPALAAAVETVLSPSRREPDQASPMVDHRGVELSPESVYRGLTSGDDLAGQMGVRLTLAMLQDTIAEVERRETERLAAGLPSAGATPPPNATFRLEPEQSGSDIWPPTSGDTVIRPRGRDWLT